MSRDGVDRVKKGDEIEENKCEEELEDFLMYLKIAGDVAQEKGKLYEFECPICKGKATAIKNTYNEHLWSKCERCDMTIIE